MPQDPSAADIHGRDFPTGAVVFEAGDPGSRTYVVSAGEVRIEERVGGHALTLARGTATSRSGSCAPGSRPTAACTPRPPASSPTTSP